MTSPRPDTASANTEATARMVAAEPVLVDVQAAIDVVPGMTRQTILTSGAPLPWDDYYGGQRTGVIGAALYERLAETPDDADRLLRSGEIRLAACHDHGCVGSLAGIYSASMPVFVVENRIGGNRGFCNLFEGPSPARLNYGVWNDEVRANLEAVEHVFAPVLRDAVRSLGGVPLRPIMRRALHMGDELHSRNTAATLLFGRELFAGLMAAAQHDPDRVAQTLDYLRSSDYFFLRLSMAASKVTADSARGVAGASIVTAMAFSCREFSIRVSGLGDEWFSAPLPEVEAKLFAGFGVDDIEFMGGESIINETVGLGGFAQAAAFPLQDYQGGSPVEMIEANLAMYEITVAEHPEFTIPYLRFRGTPVGIDIHRVVETGIAPVMDIGVAGRAGGQIGAGLLRAPLACFAAAAAAHAARYGTPAVTSTRGR
jgi:hypothetical protein